MNHHQTRNPNPADPAADAYLPPHVYANWLILAARIVVEIGDTDPDEHVPPAESEAERQAWRQWAKEHLQRIEADRRPPVRGTAKARRIGHMSEAEPDRSGARPGPKAGSAELFSVAIAGSAPKAIRRRAGTL